MAITSEIIGPFNLPGYGFTSNAPATYELPKYNAGMSISIVRWTGSDRISFDLLSKDTGEVLYEIESSSYAIYRDFSPTEFNGAVAKGALLRSNNSTNSQVYIIPNRRQTLPVWNGQ